MKIAIVAALAVLLVGLSVRTGAAATYPEERICTSYLSTIKTLRTQQRSMARNFVNATRDGNFYPAEANNASQMVLILGQEVANYREMFVGNHCGGANSLVFLDEAMGEPVLFGDP